MTRTLLTLSFLVSSFAVAAEPAKPVEILRGPKRSAAKKSAATADGEQKGNPDAALKKQGEALNAKEQALNAREGDLNAREAAVNQREADAAKNEQEAKERAEKDKSAKAKQQKALEDLVHKTQGEFGSAADALGGE